LSNTKIDQILKIFLFLFCEAKVLKMVF